MIVTVGGVAGSGKTTIGALLARRLSWPFADADSFHSAASIAKMRSGTALDDSDRWPWLGRIAAWMDERIASGQSAVLSCSALKRSYRSMLASGRPAVRLVFLAADHDLLLARLTARHGHYFSAALLDSQFADLEPVSPAEDALVLDAARTPDQLCDEIISRLGLAASPPGAALGSAGQ